LLLQQLGILSVCLFNSFTHYGKLNTSYRNGFGYIGYIGWWHFAFRVSKAKEWPAVLVIEMLRLCDRF